MSARALIPLLALLIACGGSTAEAPSPAAPPPLPVGRTLKSTVVVISRPAGQSTITYLPDGQLSFSYQHLDNGRGPKFEGKATLLPDGTLASFEAHGKHTMGTPIDETFSLTAGHARWSSHEETDEKDVSAPAFYITVAPLPETVALLFAALQKAGGTLALLPGGEAHLERAGETSVKNDKGEEKKLVAWAVTGLALTPTRFYAEQDNSYFGMVDAWYSCVADGWESAIPALVEFQNGLDRARDAAMAEKLTHHPPKAGLAFVHARVLDVEKGVWLPDQTVVVVGDKISALGPSKKIKPPKGAELIDAKGKALLPGFWDMHAHLGAPDGALDIGMGVTTARDLGNDPDQLDDYKKRYDSGTAIGPHVLRSGFIEGRGEKAAGSKITAETEEEAKAAVEFYAARGYEGIKIYNSMKPELVPVLAKLAHEKGMRVSGHVPAFMRAEDVVRAGYDEIQHANMLFLNFFVEKDTDTRTPLRFSLVAEKAPGLDLASPEVSAFLQLLIEHKTVVDPTLNAFEWLFLARPGAILPGLVEMADRLPVQFKRGFKTGGLPVPEGKDEHYQAAFQKMLALTKLLHQRGIPIVSGTDSIAGLTLHHELELYAQAGIANADVLRFATLGAARVMKLDGNTGSIAPKKTADLILVDGDPLAKIADSKKVVLTVKGGAVFKPAEVLPLVGVRP